MFHDVVLATFEGGDRHLMCDALLLLLGGVPRSPNLWGDPQHPTVWIPRWPRSRQRPAGGYRGRSGSISSSRRGWGARTNRASSQNSHQTTRRPHSPPPVTFIPSPPTLQPLSAPGRSLHHTRALQRDSVCINYPLTSFSPGEHCDQMSTLQPCVVVMWFLCCVSVSSCHLSILFH